MFEGILAGSAYIFISYIVFLLTWFFLYFSLSRNNFISKKSYILCSIISAIMLIIWSFVIKDSDIGKYPVTYLIIGMLIISLPLSGLWLRGNKFYTFLLSFIMCIIYVLCIVFVLFLSGRHFEFYLSGLTNGLIFFYMSVFFGILILFLSYLPRRTNARLDRAAVIVSVFAMAFILGDVVLNFVRPLHDTPLLVSDIAVCTLTAASYILLLFAGKSAAPQPQPESEGNGQQPESEGNDPESRDQQTIPETHAG